MYVMLDNRRVPRELAQIPAFDFWGGIAATARIFNGVAWRIDRHLDNLARAARDPAVGFSTALSPERIKFNLTRLICDNQNYDGVAAMVIFGAGTRLLIATSPSPPLTENGGQCGATAIATAASQLRGDPLAGYGWIACPPVNGAANLARRASADFGGIYDEQRNLRSVAFYADNLANEAAVFAVSEQTLITPPNENHNLAADVARDAVFEIAAQLGIVAYQEPLTAATLARASEIFVVASALDLLPLRQFDDRQFRDFPLTRRLQAAWRQLQQRECTAAD